jgi:hypothetical protein
MKTCWYCYDLFNEGKEYNEGGRYCPRCRKAMNFYKALKPFLNQK